MIAPIVSARRPAARLSECAAQDPPDGLPAQHPPAGPAPLIARLLPFLRERRFEAGDRLPSERELAARFGVSRANLREALAVLEATRVVERRPQSGIFLRASHRDAGLDALLVETDCGVPLTEADVRDLYEFRSVLELQAVDLAARRCGADDLARIDAAVADGARRLSAGESLADHDTAFHLTVFEATHNQFLVRAANWFYLASHARRAVYFADPDNGRRSLAQHRSLRNAIARQDPAAAVARMRRHLGGVERYWLSTLTQRDADRRGGASR